MRPLEPVRATGHAIKRCPRAPLKVLAAGHHSGCIKVSAFVGQERGDATLTENSPNAHGAIGWELCGRLVAKLFKVHGWTGEQKLLGECLPDVVKVPLFQLDCRIELIKEWLQLSVRLHRDYVVHISLMLLH